MTDKRERAPTQALAESDHAWGFVCIAVFAVMGYIHSPLWVALLGGVLFGMPSLAKTILMVRGACVPLFSWELLAIYARAIVHGVSAAVAGFFIGWGISAYWAVTP